MTQEKLPVYQIVVDGALDASWAVWLEGFEIQTGRGPDGRSLTRLSGPADQPALRGILNKLWDMNLELVSLQRLQAATLG